MLNSHRSLNGRKVVITGASSGIGRATALAYASEGARLVLVARRREPLEDVAVQCEALGTTALVVPADVTDASAMHTVAEQARAHFGAVDVWINNVGTGAVGSFTEVPISAHRRVIETNLIGHMNGAHAVLPHFIARRRGVLINMISVGGWVATPYASAYSASKFGVRGFAQALRAEVSRWPDIHVCDVYPAFVDTPGVAHGANYTGRGIRPMPPVYDPRQVAEAMVKLAVSPRATTMVGSITPWLRAGVAVAPNVSGHVARWFMDRAFKFADPAPVKAGNLFEPQGPYQLDGGYKSTAPMRVAPAVGLAVLGALALRWWMKARA
ncbi:MAG TPA: SDR family oxidoreductase [Burkholderiaceae bacterium]|nr:SDR family oxidoreductase [Burkholderiaceae bacterium]